MNMNSAYKVVVFALFATAANAQVSTNASLSGKYFFRQVALLTSATATGGSASISQTESAWGTLTFDGLGGFTVSGSQLAGTTASTALSGTGTYTVNPGGYVTLSNPLLPGVTVNARLGADGLLVGSSTEAGPDTFDLLIAFLGAVNPVTNRTLNGPIGFPVLNFRTAEPRMSGTPISSSLPTGRADWARTPSPARRTISAIPL